MIPNEQSMRYLGEHIPDLADTAFAQAYWQTLAEGSCVLIVEHAEIIEGFPPMARVP